ncbi:TetR/AcrR family transcriptional regulator [Chryseobacterium paridis]|uniref:TetR/AcrR family transcriptional regulator n=1 Tax=Chryseobacterium paridis TaxID=2800328 RepID=A0ABS1FWN3_9FLAO|nr:TetR/AcrR family transcriptional regulator [Chryseobacterium paridis]MBK1896743.1 TetR/AcrR family transcriptional regulator [Chryseobacterium paridis]
MNTKDRIMETADKLFYFQGYQTTGINQIIDEANVAKGSLYNHFPSKKDLGHAYVKQSSDQWFKGLEKELELWSDPAEKLLAIFSFLEKYAKINQFNGCRLINILTEVTDQDDQITEMVVAHKQRFRELLYQITTKIDIGVMQAREVSDTIYLLYEAATVDSKIFKDDWPIQLARKNAEQFLNQNKMPNNQ